MNDLLARSLRRDKVSDEVLPTHHHNVEMTSRKVEAQSMADFFQEIGVVQGEVNNCKQLLLQIKKGNEESKGIHKAEPLQALRKQIDANIMAVTKSARFMKTKLIELDNANLKHRQVKGCEEGTAIDRQRMALTANQRKKLKELMDEFQSLRATMGDEYKETIARRYYTVTGKQADEETIENMIRTGESETFLQQAIREQGRGHLLETIREVQERHEGAKLLERHFMELHSIFMDISVLVDAQGQMINDIESNVIGALSFTERGTRHLEGAKRHQRSKRKWTCICVLLLIILIIVLLIVLKVINVIP
jgi:syntaxin 1B/2/3